MCRPAPKKIKKKPKRRGGRGKHGGLVLQLEPFATFIIQTSAKKRRRKEGRGIRKITHAHAETHTHAHKHAHTHILTALP